MKFFKKIWPSDKNQDTKEALDIPHKKQSYIDIIISLNTDKQIDFSLFVDDKIESLAIDPIDYIKLCSDFLSVVLSENTKTDAIHILDKQIKNNTNKFFIESLIELLQLQQSKNNCVTKNKSFIKPSEVFARYTV